MATKVLMHDRQPRRIVRTLAVEPRPEIRRRCRTPHLQRDERCERVMAAQVCSDAIGRIDTCRCSGGDVRFAAAVARRTDRRSERRLCHIAIRGSRCDPGVRRERSGRVRTTHHSNKRTSRNRDHEHDMKRTSRGPAS